MAGDSPEELFDAVAAAVEHDPPTGRERGFGASGLKAGGKLFAMLVEGKLVVKVPRARAQALVDDGAATPFDPGHGRVMREWVCVPPASGAQWAALAEEARAYVGPGSR